MLRVLSAPLVVVLRGDSLQMRQGVIFTAGEGGLIRENSGMCLLLFFWRQLVTFLFLDKEKAKCFRVSDLKAAGESAVFPKFVTAVLPHRSWRSWYIHSSISILPDQKCIYLLGYEVFSMSPAAGRGRRWMKTAAALQFQSRTPFMNMGTCEVPSSSLDTVMAIISRKRPARRRELHVHVFTRWSL